MKSTYYTVPEVSSLEDNRIKDFSVVESIPFALRLVQLQGIPLRIEIDAQNKWVEVKSTVNIDLSCYKESLEKLLSFFYAKAYLFGYVDNNNNLFIYDIYANDNFFSLRDLRYINDISDIPIAEPLAEGHFTFSSLVANTNGLANWYLLPSVYINDPRKKTAEKPTYSTNVIIGEKKVYQTWNGTYSSGTSVKSVSNTPKKEPASTPSTNEEKELLFSLVSKDERKQIVEQVKKNIEDRINKKFNGKHEYWGTGRCNMFTYLYALLTLPQTRSLAFSNPELYYSTDFLTTTEKWTYCFVDYFEEYFFEEFNKTIFTAKEMQYIGELFKEEFEALETFWQMEGFVFEDDFGWE